MMQSVSETTAGSGPQEAEADFAEFADREFRLLLGTLSLLLGDRWQAEDIAQEALARAWLRWGRVSGLERPDLWVRRVAVNLAHSWWHRQRSAQAAQARLRADPPAPVPEAALPDEALHRAIAGLTPRQRPAIVLRYFLDLSVADTARVMGCREGTVKALTAQAVARLRRTLSEQEVDR